MAVLSIIIPVYGASDLFRKTYESIPIDERIEVIVVERPSTDMLEQENLLEGTRYLSQKSIGHYWGILEGFDVASGCYGLWINCGDVALFDVGLIEIIQRVKIEGIFVFNRSWHAKRFYSSRRNLLSAEFAREGKYDGKNRRYIMAESILFPVKFFKNSKAFHTFSLAGDYFLWKDLFTEVKNVYRLDMSLVSFLIHEGRSKTFKKEYEAEIGKVRRNILSKFFSRFFLKVKYDYQVGIDSMVEFESCLYEFSYFEIRILSRFMQFLK